MKNLKLILFLFLFVSCGYQFEGGGYINNDVTFVAVNMLENKTSQARADILFTNSLIKEIIEKTDTKIVDDSRASAVLKGSINAITFKTLSRSTTESVIERRITASVDIKLINQDGQIIWTVKNFTSDEEYKVSEDTIADESNKRAAVEKISIRIAEKLVSKMLNNF
jgi:hypothetical protein